VNFAGKTANLGASPHDWGFAKKLRPGFKSWSRHALFAILFPFFSFPFHYYTNCLFIQIVTFWNEEKRAKMAIGGSKCHFLAFLRFLDHTIHRTVMHRHDDPQIPK
jgi:hypothetical protein